MGLSSLSSYRALLPVFNKGFTIDREMCVWQLWFRFIKLHVLDTPLEWRHYQQVWNAVLYNIASCDMWSTGSTACKRITGIDPEGIRMIIYTFSLWAQGSSEMIHCLEESLLSLLLSACCLLFRCEIMWWWDTRIPLHTLYHWQACTHRETHKPFKMLCRNQPPAESQLQQSWKRDWGSREEPAVGNISEQSSFLRLKKTKWSTSL